MISLGKVLKNITVLCLLGLTMTSTNAFVLLGSSAPPRYPSGDIQIKLVGNQACSTITESTEELIEIAKEAADDFWNTVHTSSINLMVTGKVSAGGKDITDFISAANNNIVIGCSTDSIIYSTSTIAVGGYSYTSGNLKGYVALNDFDFDQTKVGVGKMFVFKNDMIFVDPKIVYDLGAETTNLQIGFGLKF